MRDWRFVEMGSLYKRGGIWWLKYYQNGRAVRESSKSAKETVARRILRLREGDIEHGIVINPQLNRILFDQALADFLTDYETNRRKTAQWTKRRVEKHLKPAFAGRLLANIGPSDVRSYTATRQAAGAQNATINRELAALKRIFSLALQGGKISSRPYIPMLREQNVRKGYLEAEQLEAVCGHLPADVVPVARFAYLSGWRVPSEVLPVQWRQVDWTGRCVRLDPGTTKSGEGRTFPFTRALEALLTAQRDRTQAMGREHGEIVPWVFHRRGAPIRSFRGAWAAARKAAGVPGRLLHDFRRTAVRNLERASVSRSAAMAMVGHKTEALYRRFAIVDATALREAAAKLDAVSEGSSRLEEANGRPS